MDYSELSRSCTLMRRERHTRELSPLCEDTGRGQPSATQEEFSPGTKLTDTLILSFPASRTMKNKCLLFEPPGLRHLVINSISRLIYSVFITSVSSENSYPHRQILQNNPPKMLYRIMINML